MTTGIQIIFNRESWFILSLFDHGKEEERTGTRKKRYVNDKSLLCKAKNKPVKSSKGSLFPRCLAEGTIVNTLTITTDSESRLAWSNIFPVIVWQEIYLDFPPGLCPPHYTWVFHKISNFSVITTINKT
jgi:hypothetical protein